MKNKTMKYIVIKGNGKYLMPLKQYKALVRKFSENRLDIDHENERKNTTKIIKKYVEEGDDYTISIACGIIGGTLLVIIIVRPN